MLQLRLPEWQDSRTVWEAAHRVARKRRALRRAREACEDCPREVIEAVVEILAVDEEATAAEAPVPEEVIMRQLLLWKVVLTLLVDFQ